MEDVLPTFVACIKKIEKSHTSRTLPGRTLTDIFAFLKTLLPLVDPQYDLSEALPREIFKKSKTNFLLRLTILTGTWPEIHTFERIYSEMRLYLKAMARRIRHNGYTWFRAGHEQIRLPNSVNILLYAFIWAVPERELELDIYLRRLPSKIPVPSKSEFYVARSRSSAINMSLVDVLRMVTPKADALEWVIKRLLLIPTYVTWLHRVRNGSSSVVDHLKMLGQLRAFFGSELMNPLAIPDHEECMELISSIQLVNVIHLTVCDAIEYLRDDGTLEHLGWKLFSYFINSALQIVHPPFPDYPALCMALNNCLNLNLFLPDSSPIANFTIVQHQGLFDDTGLIQPCLWELSILPERQRPEYHPQLEQVYEIFGPLLTFGSALGPGDYPLPFDDVVLEPCGPELKISDYKCKTREVDNRCCICCTDLIAEPVVTLTCGHVQHEECMNILINGIHEFSNRCPLCRIEICPRRERRRAECVTHPEVISEVG